MNNQALSEADVSIDKKINLSTKTNETGYFEIKDVSQGDHEIEMVKNYTNGSYVKRSYNISVDDDLHLESLILPKAVNFYEIKEFTHNTAGLKWSVSNAVDFREYKLYRHTTSGLDEDTGTLVHVATSITDTAFTDESLAPNQIYYYRIYVMNAYGRLGGSNIEDVKTTVYNIIKNNSFEELNIQTLFPDDWDFHNYGYPGTTQICDTAKIHSGKYSFKASFDTTSGRNDYILIQRISVADLIEGQTYKLKLWVEHTLLLEWWEGIRVLIRTQDQIYYLLNEKIISGPTNYVEWTEYSIEFTVPSGISASNYDLLIQLSQNPAHNSIYWLDDVELFKL